MKYCDNKRLYKITQRIEKYEHFEEIFLKEQNMP